MKKVRQRFGRRGLSIPVSVFNHVIPQCAEDVEENEGNKPVIFGWSGYVGVIGQVDQHPQPEPDQQDSG